MAVWRKDTQEPGIYGFFVSHDDCAEIGDWCEYMWGSQTSAFEDWSSDKRHEWKFLSGTFYFNKEEVAILFKLTWS